MPSMNSSHLKILGNNETPTTDNNRSNISAILPHTLVLLHIINGLEVFVLFMLFWMCIFLLFTFNLDASCMQKIYICVIYTWRGDSIMSNIYVKAFLEMLSSSSLYNIFNTFGICYFSLIND